MDDLQMRFNRGLVDRLEALEGRPESERGAAELRELLMAMDLTARIKAAAPRPAVDWLKLLPLLLGFGVVLAALLAALLGVDVRGLL